MKSSQLITICLLHALTQIEGQINIAACGRLDTKYLIPFVAKSFSANHHWPWHAAVYHQYNKSNPIYQCGGTLISERWVLTAAHCVSFNNAQLDVELVAVALGRLNLAKNENSGQSFGVNEILVYPDYNSIDYINDIALIRLSANAIFNNYVQPICLWKSDRTDLSEVLGKNGTVVGWGLTESGVISSVLQQAHFPVVDFYTCVKSNPPFFGQILTNANFCAGHRNGTGLCQGDSGGSISFEENGIYYIRGIVSVGQGKPNPITQKIECDSMQFAVFTDVAKFLPWIKHETTVERAIKLFDEPARLSGVTESIKEETDLSIFGQLSTRPMPLITRSHDTHHWPWHAAIYHKLSESDPVYRCGGTLISSKTILTAAPCVQIDANNISVSLGRLNLGTPENSAQSFQVAEVLIHPEFDLDTLRNDIAIIELATEAVFNHYVRPICLWKSDKTDFSEILGKFGTVVGWGLTETGEQSNLLQEASLPVVSHIGCLRSLRNILSPLLLESNYCAGHRNGTTVCSGDNGGSMTFEENGIYYIRGIVSTVPAKIDETTGEYICDSTQYTVFTDVAKFLSWIREEIINMATDFSICVLLSTRPMPLIVRSHDTHHWPWHAAIFHKCGESDPVYKCGGTLISSKTILTAVPCVQVDANNISVSLGRLNLGTPENSAQSFEVTKTIAHPEFNEEGYENNIAIIELSTDAVFNRYVRPICLWQSDRTELSEVVGKLGTVVGWGQTETGELSNVLQEASLPVVSLIKCLQSDRAGFGRFLSENNYCAGHRNGTSVCSGDIGGSMAFKENGIYYIRGIVSFGLTKSAKNNVQCDSTQYAIFTDVAKFLPWIKEGHQYGKRFYNLWRTFNQEKLNASL